MELTPPAVIVVPATLTAESVGRLRVELAEQAERRPTALVLRGCAGRFCAGLDVEEIGHSPTLTSMSVDAFADCLDALQRFPAPVIAAVTGPATGGGVGLAAAADVVLATSTATFALTELLFGLVPAIVAPALLTRLSPARFRLWAMTAERWDADTARRAGLVDDVVDDGIVDDAIAGWLRRLSRADREAVTAMKRFICDRSPGREADGAALTAARLRSPQVRDRLRAFVQDGVVPWR